MTQRICTRWLLTRSVLVAAMLGGLATFSLPRDASAQMVFEKSCGKCGQIVPITSQPGQTCPHCGVYWGRQSNRVVRGPEISDGGSMQDGRPTIYLPMPRNSLERMALYQALAQRQMVQQQMLRELLLERQRELRHQQRFSQCQKERDRKAAAREKRIERIRAKAAEDRRRRNLSGAEVAGQ